jgi:metal-responsive CopG/Arc/MetJ family transcriptional regulator
MRTTIDIEDDLMLELKRVAAEQRQSLKALIQDAIRSSLTRRNSATRQMGNQTVVTFRGNGVRSGVNLDSMTELLDIMDGTP